ncbi:MAG: hypothetical protein F2825_11045 [Actinobacteria bacterium]|uniref:Unannotated protein n=1 Tax=freshwater metagenome TaxID=449393 RepID=A0A6J7ITF4_9ZZZZ|nr:hypothetical protein [Actinomycetota bacterium]
MTVATREPWNKAGAQTDSHRCCSGCYAWLPLSEFPRNRTRTAGVSAACRDCHAARRRAANDEAWLRTVELLGGRCHDCGTDLPIALHPHPITSWARHHRGAGKERKTATLARMIYAMGVDAGRHWMLICANCDLVRRHPGRACPR